MCVFVTDTTLVSNGPYSFIHLSVKMMDIFDILYADILYVTNFNSFLILSIKRVKVNRLFYAFSAFGSPNNFRVV